MATQVGSIVKGDESDVHDEPHVRGSRVTVREVYRRVHEGGLEPGTVADRHNLDIADVYHALAYYHDNPDVMATVERRYEAAAREATERSDMSPPEQS